MKRNNMNLTNTMHLNEGEENKKFSDSSKEHKPIKKLFRKNFEKTLKKNNR